jgi:hypothetical protein
VATEEHRGEMPSLRRATPLPAQRGPPRVSRSSAEPAREPQQVGLEKEGGSYLLRPFPTDEMEAFEVSKDVGNVRNNHAELLNSA